MEKAFVCRRCIDAIKPEGHMGNLLSQMVCRFLRSNREFLISFLISSGEGCPTTVVARVRLGWRKFRKLLPLLAIKGLFLYTKGRLYDTYIQQWYMVVRIGP